MRKIEKLIYTNERGETVEFSHTSVYHTNEVTGLSDIRNTIYSVNSIGQDGDTYVSNRINAREIEIVGNINEKNKDRMINQRRWLTHVLNPQLSATLTYEYGDFKRIIDCRADSAPIFKKNVILQGFAINLKCLYPFWREESEKREDIAKWIANFEFTLEIPKDEGIEMAIKEPSLIVNLYNEGDVTGGMRVDFKAIGTVVNPSLLNIDTGEAMKFNNLTLYGGDVLTVSTYYGKKNVLLKRNGLTESAFKFWDASSAYVQLSIGDNLLRYDADEGIDNLEITIHYNNMYLGV